MTHVLVCRRARPLTANLNPNSLSPHPLKQVPDELRPASSSAALLCMAHPVPLAPPPAAAGGDDWSAGEVEALIAAVVGAWVVVGWVGGREKEGTTTAAACAHY